MFQDLFLHMHQTLEELTSEFDKADDLDEELALLEKYLSIKELSEELTSELNILGSKLRDFEKEHGLLDLTLTEMDDISSNGLPSKNKEEEEEVVVELDEGDFFAFQKGIGFYDLWMYDHAIIYLQEVINKYPDFNLARLYTAMTYFKKKQYEDAKREVHLVFKMSDDEELISLGFNILGMIESYHKNFEQAIHYFQESLRLKENWTEPKFNLATLYFRLKQNEKALYLFEELYRVDPKDWEVLLYLGKIYQRLKKHELAGEFFRQTYAITKQPIVLKQIASHFEQRKNFSQAIVWYQKWLDIEPMDIAAMIGLAKNHWLSGDKDKGMVWIKKAISIHPNSTEANLLYAWMLTGNSSSKALRVVNYLAEISYSESYNFYLVANLARLYYVNRDLNNSNHFCSILLNSPHKNVKSLGHIVQGLIHLDQSSPNEALAHFEEALNKEYTFPYLDFYLGYTNYLLGRLDEAKTYWSNLIM